MTEEQQIPDLGIPDYSQVIEEQKAVIAALSEKIKNLESKQAASEAKITALASKPEPKQPEVVVKTALDEAYEKVLADLGIKKQE